MHMHFACHQQTTQPTLLPEVTVVGRTRGKRVNYHEEPLDEVDQALQNLEDDVHSGDEYEPQTSCDDSEVSCYDSEDSCNDSEDSDDENGNNHGSSSCDVKRKLKVSTAVSTREYLTNNPPETDDEEDDIEDDSEQPKVTELVTGTDTANETEDEIDSDTATSHAT